MVISLNFNFKHATTIITFGGCCKPGVTIYTFHNLFYLTKMVKKSHNVKMEEITKRALRNFGNIILFLVNIYPDVLQMTNVKFWIAGFTLKYTTRSQRVRVLCASDCNKML